MTLNERLSAIPKLYQLVGVIAAFTAAFSVLFNWVGFSFSAPSQRLMAIERTIDANYKVAARHHMELRSSIDSMKDADDTQLFLLCQHLDQHAPGARSLSRVEEALIIAYCSDLDVTELLRRARNRQAPFDTRGVEGVP